MVEPCLTLNEQTRVSNKSLNTDKRKTFLDEAIDKKKKKEKSVFYKNCNALIEHTSDPFSLLSMNDWKLKTK